MVIFHSYVKLFENHRQTAEMAYIHKTWLMFCLTNASSSRDFFNEYVTNSNGNVVGM